MLPRITANATIVNVQMIPRTCLFDFDNEEEEFLQEFMHVIYDQNLLHAEDQKAIDENDQTTDAIDTRCPLHQGVIDRDASDRQTGDTYVDMIIGRRRDPEQPLERARVK